MEKMTVLFQPQNVTVEVCSDESLLQAQIRAGLHPDAPCGGKGTCGKCKVWVDGQEVLACQTGVRPNLTVYTEPQSDIRILTTGISVQTTPDGEQDYVIAYDIGTTTVVAYLMDGHSGQMLSQSSCRNPQGQYGADVISRIQHVLQTGGAEMSDCIRKCLSRLAEEAARKAGITADRIGATAIVGNTAMHHLLLGIDPKPLVTPPYMPAVFEALELEKGVRILPNIAGFVGADTVGCMVSTRFDRMEDLTLLIDIGTNGEMVLGDGKRRIACSTAAGPAFEGAKISCGMRGAPGAVDHVWAEDGKIRYHVIGEEAPEGLCGSGLLDLVALLLRQGILDESGYLENKEFTLCDNVTLTQKDIREVQLAKAAIRAGIELLCEQLGVSVSDIRQVLLAGAFGNYMDPKSACAIGMIPPVLMDRIRPIGNAAGEGAKLCALSRREYDYSKQLAAHMEFLELASLPEFQDRYVDALTFEEEEE